MIIYTPRLCSDITFLPSQENKAHSITCQEVIHSHDIEDWKVRKAAESERELLADTQEPRIVGGIKVGAALNVGKDGKRIDSGSRGSAEDVIISKGRANGGRVEMLTDEELRKLDLDPKTIEKLGESVQNLAGGRGWILEVFNERGEKKMRVVFDDEDEDASSNREDGDGRDENTEDGEGSQAEL
jgi:protein OS-9